MDEKDKPKLHTVPRRYTMEVVNNAIHKAIAAILSYLFSFNEERKKHYIHIIGLQS